MLRSLPATRRNVVFFFFGGGVVYFFSKVFLLNIFLPEFERYVFFWEFLWIC